jgi:LacI family transcriptional regulator
MLGGIRAAAKERAGLTLRLVEPHLLRTLREVDGYIGQVAPADTASLPIVSLYSTGSNDPRLQVYSDPRAASELAFGHFRERDLTCVRTYIARGVEGARRRRAEHFETLATNASLDVGRIEFDDAVSGPASPTTVSRLAKYLLRQPRPMSVMAIDDWHGLRVIEAAAEAGLRVPDDVAVLGHNDDAPLCRFCDPPLSSVATNQQRIGYEGMKLLVDLMEGKPPPEVPIRIPPIGVVARASTDVQHTSDPAVADALRYIRDHLADGITPADVIAHAPASASTLHRRFKQHLGHGIAVQLRNARLERVRQLLVADDAPLVLVAADTGYGHVSQMCRDFKARFGSTPTEYRDAQREARTGLGSVRNAGSVSDAGSPAGRGRGA